MFDHFVPPNLLPALPEIFLAAMACFILLVDLVAKDSRHFLAFTLAQLTLVACLALQIAASAGGHTVYTFSNMFVSDLLSDVLKSFLYLTVSIVLFYSRGYILDRPAMNKGEYYVLALFSTLGMMVMISANHFVTLYLGIELLSLSLYTMVAMNRESLASTEAALKYFVLGALASGFLLYGMSMIYGATGSLELGVIAQKAPLLADPEILSEGRMLLVFGLVFLVAGLAFKLGVVPFHMWIPDVYHGAPTAATLFIGSAPKLAAFAIVIRMLAGGLLPLAADWQNMLVIMAVLSMAVGNLAAIAQTNLKRMLAYSAISHMGFMLIGIVSGVTGAFDPEQAQKAYAASMFYVLTYVLMSAGAFGMILLFARAGFEADRLEDFKGLNRRSPWFAGMMLILMFSMAGIPFFVGFFAKFAVLAAAVAAGHLWLAIAAVVFSLIGAFYYLRVVKLMYFDAPSDETPIALPIDMRLLTSANGLAVALLGIFPGALMGLCDIVFHLS